MPEIALISLGTTPGLRHADAALAEALGKAGCAVRTLRVSLGPAARLRRQISVTDLVESAAARRTARRAVGADAVISSAATTAYWYSGPAPHAIWFDSPSVLNRPGLAGAWQREAERRAVARATLLLPWGTAGAVAIRPQLGPAPPPVVSLPVPIDLTPGAAGRDIDAVAYAGWPWKRGLDLLASAWGLVGDRRRLVIGGVEAPRGRAWLARCGVDEPRGIEWAGPLQRSEWLALVGRARVFVNASRREDYGIAQLEALALGTPLVTVESPGAYEALPLARALAPALVGADLAAALNAGLALDADARSAYAERAGAALAPYRPDAVDRRLREDVLPRLLAASP